MTPTFGFWANIEPTRQAKRIGEENDFGIFIPLGNVKMQEPQEEYKFARLYYQFTETDNLLLAFEMVLVRDGEITDPIYNLHL